MEDKSTPKIEWYFTAIDEKTKARVDGRVRAMTISEANQSLQMHGLVASDIHCVNRNPQKMYTRWKKFFEKTRTDIGVADQGNIQSIADYLREREIKDQQC